MSNQPSPHDAVVRRILGQPANAASHLRAVLPATLAARLDLERLRPANGSFVDEALQWRHSDLLFTAPLDDRDAFIYVLIEHQSSPDQMMPFRMLQYMVRVWDRFRTEHRRATRLPAIIPIVLHHNSQPWPAPVEFRDVLDLDADALAAADDYLPRFQFLLDDLANVKEHELRERALTPVARVSIFLLKIARGHPGVADDLYKWADDLSAVLVAPGGREDFITLVTYIEAASARPSARPRHRHRAGGRPSARTATARNLRYGTTRCRTES